MFNKKYINSKLLNNKYIYIIILLIIILIYIYYNYEYEYNNIYEHYEQPKYKTLISNWDNESGFYSELGFKLNHYLYCKKYNINYKTNSDNWSYKYKNGWTDYFQDIELKLNNSNENNNNLDNHEIIHIEKGCCNNLEEFKIKDYVAIIPEYYKYNHEVQTIINNKKNELGLINGEYGSIYIRRGDKLIIENDFVDTDKFINKLLNKYPDCKTIFLQTDDYNCFIDLQNYIKNNNLDIKSFTLCPNNMFGSIANNVNMDKMKDNTYANKEYLEKIKNNLSKPIYEMSSDEKYDHTIELITSVDICINSKYCICDYKSNISRFIKLAHKNIMNVYDVFDADTLFDLENYKSLSWGF